MKDNTNTIMTSEPPLSRYHLPPQQLHNATNLPHHHQQIVRIGCYDVIKTIGKGNFAVVKLARHMITKLEVAIKIIDKTRLDETNLKKIYREIQILKLLRHQHIIELYQVIETSTMIYLVLEYASQGEVYDLIFNVERLEEQQARKIFYQALTAIEFCHKNNVVHRDLKAENLLLDVNGDVKLADFGFGNFYQPGKMLDTWCGSPPYAAPEVFEGKLYEGPHPDIWSLGVVLYVLVCGTFPFDGSSISTLKDRVLTGRFRIPYWMSEDCENLIRRMLVVNTKKRITINQIKKHRWLQSIVKEKQREVEVAMMTGGRSSTPQPNDLNEQVMKIMQNMDFDRQKVLESVRISSYDHNYATYQLLKKRLKKELVTSGRPMSFEASKLTHQSFKRRPSNIAEHALIKLSGSLKPAVPILPTVQPPTAAPVLPLTTVNHRQLPVSVAATTVQQPSLPVQVGYVQAAGALHMASTNGQQQQQRLPEQAEMTSELQHQIYQPQTLPFAYNGGQQAGVDPAHRLSMYHDHQHQQQQQVTAALNFRHMAPQAEVMTNEDVLAAFHDEGVELNEPPLLPPLHSSEQLPSHHLPVHANNSSLIHRRHTFVIPDMTSYAFPVTTDVNGGGGEQMNEAMTEALRRSSGFSEETFTSLPGHAQLPPPLHEYEISMAAGNGSGGCSKQSRFDASQFPKSSQTTRSSPIDDDDDDDDERAGCDVTMPNHHHRLIHPRPTTEFRCGRRASDGLLLNFGENNLLGEKLKRLTRANGFLAITQEETSATGGGSEQQSSAAIGSNCNPLQAGNNNLHQTPLFASHFPAHHQHLHQQQRCHQVLPTSSSDSTNHSAGCCFSTKPHRAHVIPVSSSSSRRRSVHAPYFVPRSGCASPHERDSPKIGSAGGDSTLEQLEQLSQQVSRVLFDSNDMDQFLSVRPSPPVVPVVAAQTAQAGHSAAVMDMFNDQSLLVDAHHGGLVPSSAQYATTTTALELTSSDEAMASLHHIDLFNRAAATNNSKGLFHQLQQRRLLERRIKSVSGPQSQQPPHHIQQAPPPQQYHLPLTELQHLRIDPDLKILPLGGVEEASSGVDAAAVDASQDCGAVVVDNGWLPYTGADYHHAGTAAAYLQPHMEYGY